jgi:signal peptide peptidase SppA
MHLARLASLIFGRPHFVTPEAARSILLAVEGKLGGPIKIEANGFVGDWAYEVTDKGRRWTGYRMHGAIAVLDMRGELVNRGTWLNADSGLISYDGMRQQIRSLITQAQAGKVKAVLIDVDCPGGEATGMSETAELMRALSSIVPVVAVANSLMCSAAYGICSGATRIVNGKFGYVGSIGCVMVHADYSEHLAQAGVKVTLIHKGAHKVDGNPYEPLPKAVRAEYEATAARYYDDFVATVAAGRPSLTDKDIRATEARTYHGADAVAAGLADAVGTFDAELARLEQQIAATSAAKPTAPAVSSNAQPGAPTMDKTHTQADVDAARADGTKAGAKGERERMAAIINTPEAQANAALAAHLAFATDTPATEAVAMLKAAGPAAKPAAAAPAPATAMGLELAGPTPAANAKPQATIDTAAIYAKRAAARRG